MRIKRWVCALLCLLLLTGLMPAGVVRADAVHQNFEYRLDEAGNVTITGYRDKSVTDLEVPEKILGHPVTVILGNTFRSCEALRSLVLPESLQTMLDNLQNCRNLERIYVYSPEMDLWGALTNARIYTHLEKTPVSLVSTKNYCPFEEFGFDPRTQPVFTEGCMTYALHEGEACLLEAKPEGDFTVPDTLGGCPVTRIAPCCFLGASMLRGLTLPDTVRIIGRGALQPEYVGAPGNPIRLTALPAALEYVGDSALAQIDLSRITTLPAGLSHVGFGGFEQCRLQKLTIPESLKVIRTEAFANNPLKEIVLEEGVEEIYSLGFSISSGRITIPRSVRILEKFWSDGPVYGKPKDLEILCDAEGPAGAFLLEQGVGFHDLDTGEYYAEPYTCQQDGVKYRILPRRYAEVIGLELGVPADLVIPDTVEGLPVEKVRDWALCSEVLRSIELPDTVNYIAEDAMIDCSNLERLRLSEGLESLNPRCILNCGKLQVLHIPASVTEITEDTFGRRILTGEPGSYAERYARRRGLAFVPEEPGATYIAEGPALCRVEPEGAVLAALISTWGPNGYFDAAFDMPDTAGGLPIVAIDGDIVFADTAEELYLGRFVQRIEDGALDASGIRRLYTYPALTELPEELFTRALGVDDGKSELWGFRGSYAQRYAESHGLRFIEIDGVPFTDVPRESWFYGPVYECYWSGLMRGTSETAFSPQSSASRAMLVTVLWRMMNCPSHRDRHFEDVPYDIWYDAAVNWAAENGVVYGTGPSRFSPNVSVTREQTAAILFRLAAAMGLPVDSFAPLGGFGDAAQASDYARSALMWAVEAGILQGNDRAMLRPQGTATRAELAAMLTRFLAWCEREAAR